MKQLRRVLLITAVTLLGACKHPLEIDGQGDIIETARGVRGCSVDEFQAGLGRCTNNTVTGDEDVVYRALPRPGWRFSHWEGCGQVEPGADCPTSYSQALADFWDDRSPNQTWAPLRAVFTQDGQTLSGSSYIASQFGGVSDTSYAALLDAQFDSTGGWRFTTQQATQPAVLISRREYIYRRSREGLVSSGVDTLSEAGAATDDFDLVGLVDMDGDDTSITYFMPKRDKTDAGLFAGSWYCGHISTRIGPRRQGGYARFFSAQLNDSGGGVFTIIADRWGDIGSQVIGYSLFEDGTARLNYLGVQLTGSLSADGNVFVGSEIASDARGVGACVRQSSGNTLGNVAGRFYGTYVTITSPLYTAVVQRDFTTAGSGDLTIRRDSLARRDRRFNDYVLVGFSGQLQTGTRDGALSPDGKVLFLVDVREGELPSFSLLVREQ